MNKIITYILVCIACIITSCSLSVANKPITNRLPQIDSVSLPDTLTKPKQQVEEVKPKSLQISKELLYDKYTLSDTYPYKDTTRSFQWDKIKERLTLLEEIQLEPQRWGILQNYRNWNREAPLVKKFRRNSFKRIADTFGIERYQSIPLYLLTDTLVPERYGKDGSLVRLLQKEGGFSKVEPIQIGGTWKVPSRYIKAIPDTVLFKKAIVIDRKNQHIVTLEQKEKGQWIARSMNPATTGVHRPPYAQKTPLGIFVLQQKKRKMIYLKDGTVKTGGYAPYASRFTYGAYIHGIPVNTPRTSFIEYSPSLGTIPRSHMCVRNATSHAKFVFDWAPVYQTIIFIIE